MSGKKSKGAYKRIVSILTKQKSRIVSDAAFIVW
jgi:hypothetical protein